MMAEKKKGDKFVNLAFGTITESAANTLTFSEIQTHISVFEKEAWIIHRIQWFPTAYSFDKLVGVADYFTLALTVSNKVTTLDLSDPAVIDLAQVVGVLHGAAANLETLNTPLSRDFSTLPGGGIIITPRPLYLAIKGTSLADPVAAQARIFFTHQTLAAEDYWELVEARRMIE